VNPSWSCAVEVNEVGCRRLKCRYEISGLGKLSSQLGWQRG